MVANKLVAKSQLPPLNPDAFSFDRPTALHMVRPNEYRKRSVRLGTHMQPRGALVYARQK